MLALVSSSAIGVAESRNRNTNCQSDIEDRSTASVIAGAAISSNVSPSNATSPSVLDPKLGKAIDALVEINKINLAPIIAMTVILANCLGPVAR